jgi:hypothetical protein
MFAYVNGENPELSLISVGNNKYEVEVSDDQTKTEALLASKVKADKYISGGKASKIVFWERVQGNTLQSFTTPMEGITYEVEVPEDGKYDFALSVSTVSNQTSTKALFINDSVGTFFIPETSDYTNLQGLRVKCGVELKKGKQQITFMNMDDGRCIFDWFGIIKCAE